MDKLRRTLIAALATVAVPLPLSLRAQQGADAGYTTLANAL